MLLWPAFVPLPSSSDFDETGRLNQPASTRCAWDRSSLPLFSEWDEEDNRKARGGNCHFSVPSQHVQPMCGQRFKEDEIIAVPHFILNRPQFRLFCVPNWIAVEG